MPSRKSSSTSGSRRPDGAVDERQRDPGIARALGSGLRETTRRVEALHGTLSATTFGLLRRIPFAAAPLRLAEEIHDTVAGGVYAVVRHGGGALLDAAASLEESALAPGTAAGRRVGALRAALNAVAGDSLAAADSVLAIPMAFYVDGRRLPLDALSLAAALPEASRRIVVFIHGFGCDEGIWLDPVRDQPAGSGAPAPSAPFGERLAADLGVTPVYLRFNSGLPIADNGREFGDLLDALVAAWPVRQPEIVLVGHSAGGLVARCACEAADDGGDWPRWGWQRRTRLLVCLATPHQGAPLENLADLATQALSLSPLTRSLGDSAAARRRHIEGLRREFAQESAGAPTRGIAYRLLGGCLAEDVEHPLGELLGDGVVTLSAATASTYAATGDVASERVGGVGHLALLFDERVYQHLRGWIEEALRKSLRRRKPPPAAA